MGNSQLHESWLHKKLVKTKIAVGQHMLTRYKKNDSSSKIKNICCTCSTNHFGAVSLLDQQWMTDQIATGGQ